MELVVLLYLMLEMVVLVVVEQHLIFQLKQVEQVQLIKDLTVEHILAHLIMSGLLVVVELEQRELEVLINLMVIQAETEFLLA